MHGSLIIVRSWTVPKGRDVHVVAAQGHQRDVTRC
jgi:hypothetical protein